MADILPPRPPASRNKLHAIEIKIPEPKSKRTKKKLFEPAMPLPPKDVVDSEPLAPIPLKKNKKGGFLKKLFAKNETSNSNLDLPSGEDLPVFHSFKAEEQIQKEPTEEDINNIREALGVVNNKRRSIQAEFEEEVSKEHAKKTSQKPINSAVIKKPSSKSKSKSKYATKKTSKEKIPLKRAVVAKMIKLEKPRKPAKVHPSIKKTQDHLKELHLKLEESKNELIQETKVRKPQVLKAQARIKEETKKHQESLKETFKKEKDALAKEAREFEVLRAKIIKALDSDRKKIIAQQALIDKKNEEQKMHDEEIFNKQKKINEQVVVLENFSKEIKILNKSIKDNKTEINKHKKIISDLKESVANEKILTSEAKKSLSKLRDEIKKKKNDINANFLKFETDHQKSMNELNKEAELAAAELEKIKKESEKIHKELDIKEKRVDKKLEKLNELMAEEKRIADFLSGKGSANYDLVVNTPKNKALSKTDSFIAEPKVVESYKVELFSSSKEAVADLQDKIDDCKVLISDGKIEDAKLLYNEIREEFLNIEIKANDKVLLKTQIKTLYDNIAKDSF